MKQFIRRIIWTVMNWYHRFRMPKMLTFGYYWSLFVIPFLWLGENWRHQRTRDLLFGIPAILGIIAVLAVVGQTQIQNSSLTASYYLAAEDSIVRKNYDYAELLLRRVLKRGDAHYSDAQYAMAILLDETGEKKRASQLFALLAPDDSRGNADAHRHLAMILANDVTWRSDPEDIKRLYWHLSAPGVDDSPAMAMAWGKYYLAVRDIKTAKQYFERAVDSFPELWQTLGIIEAATGNSAAAMTSYRNSSKYLSKKLGEDPESQRLRVDYAQVLINLGSLEDARSVLEHGKNADPDGPWQGLLASLAVGYHDMLAAKGAPMSEVLTHLDRALSYDPNHGPALNRLMAYSKAEVNGNTELRTVLEGVIADGDHPALAHLAMGNLCWMENAREQAMIHFEMALEVRNDMGPLLNNMAWLVAHDKDEPDLERAMGLISAALETKPEDPSYLDTRGTIHFLGKKWREARVDLEKSLSGVRDKAAVHEKLAVVYDELKMQGIANQHRKLATE